MSKFQGFTTSETFTRIPDTFFRHLLNEIEDMDELRVTLYAIWLAGNMEGQLHFLREGDFSECLPHDPEDSAAQPLSAALDKAVQRGTLIRAANQANVLYFLNSPRGRASAEAFTQGRWQPDTDLPFAPPRERPNIFRLYEENIGPLTPLVADTLKDAESTYPPDWVAEALEIAVLKNKRNWKYVEAILKRWKEEGHAKKQDRRDAQADGRRYAEGEYADFIEH